MRRTGFSAIFDGQLVIDRVGVPIENDVVSNLWDIKRPVHLGIVWPGVPETCLPKKLSNKYARVSWLPSATPWPPIVVVRANPSSEGTGLCLSFAHIQMGEERKDAPQVGEKFWSMRTGTKIENGRQV